MNSIAARLACAIEKSGLSYRQIAELSGVAKSAVQRYAKAGTEKIPVDRLKAIANAIGADSAEIMGWSSNGTESDKTDVFLSENVQPISELSMHRIPMIGEIAAGQPIVCEQDYETVVPGPIGANFALTVQGDSMEPTYLTGDIVYLRQQDDVDNGQVAAVIIDNEATLKHVYHIPNGLTLVSDNTAYPPRVVTMPGYDNIRILGLVIGYTRMYNRG